MESKKVRFLRWDTIKKEIETLYSNLDLSRDRLVPIIANNRRDEAIIVSLPLAHIHRSPIHSR